MSPSLRILPKRVIGSVLLLGGAVYLPALCAQADPYVTPAGEQVAMAGPAGPAGLPPNTQVVVPGRTSNITPQILPQAAPPIPGAADSKIEGMPTTGPQAAAPAN